MNVLFICHEYPPGKSGGIGSATRTLARAMTAMGHRVFVAGLYVPGYGQKDYEEDAGVRIWRRRFHLDIGLVRNNYSRLDSFWMRIFHHSGGMRWDAVRSVRRFHSFILELIEKFDIDIVEWPDFNECFRWLPESFEWASLPVPLVIKYHGTQSYINHNMRQKINPRIYALEKKHIARADALASVSRNTADNYATFYGIGNKVTVLYNSIDLPEVLYDPDRATPTIVFTGTLTPLKGIYSLLEAWPAVLAERSDARLRVFGKGKIAALRSQLAEAARESVSFEGFVTRDRLYDSMATASAAIFPSYSECFAVAPLEAMAVGCPVIYTQRVSGPELIRPDVNGLLVDPDDLRGIADAILLLLNDPDRRAIFSVKGRQTIEQRFDIRLSVAQHIKFYGRIKQRTA